MNSNSGTIVNTGRPWKIGSIQIQDIQIKVAEWGNEIFTFLLVEQTLNANNGDNIVFHWAPRSTFKKNDSGALHYGLQIHEIIVQPKPTTTNEKLF